MKTLNEILSLVLLLFLSKDGALAQPDTIDGLHRYRNYYYTEWIDQCPHYDNRYYDSSSYEKYMIDYYSWKLAKTEYTPRPLKVRGLAIMNDMLPHGPCLTWDHAVEYLYLYQRTDTFNFVNHGAFPPFQMYLLDSVRWDTISPKILSISNAPFDTIPQRCYIREAYFDKPVYVESTFCIYSSSNGNRRVPNTSSPLYYNQPFTIMQVVPTRTLVPDTNNNTPKISGSNYYNECRGGGEWTNVLELCGQNGYNPGPNYHDTIIEGERFWKCLDWPHDPFGPFFAIVYHFEIQGISADESMGTVLGGGLVPEEQSTTLTAHALPGYRFTHWNDGNTNNPRSVVSERDTQFIAYFVEMSDVEVVAEANNAAWGSVEGGGTYPYGSTVTLEATAADSCFFEMWADGVLEPSRTVNVTSDTLFTALFAFDSALLGVTFTDVPALTVTPNPAHTQISVACDEAMSLVTLRDISGRTVLEARSTATSTVLNVSQLPSGTYILTATTVRGTASRKLVVQ